LAGSRRDGRDVTCKGLDLNSKQADKALLLYLSAAGAKIMRNSEGITIRSTEVWLRLKLTSTQTPDLLPAAAVLACSIKGFRK
jgi:5-enolpyruvylshikimate-3-phosphate synthase